MWRSLLDALLSLIVVLVAWPALLWLFNVSPFVAKTPLQIWQYLVTNDDAATNAARLFSALGQTLSDASIGFVTGLSAALVGAVLFLLARPIEHAFMPFAMLMRSMPLVAMAPVIILLFGRGTLTVAMLGGLVVFFPALVTIVFALRSTPAAMTDLIQVYGGSRIRELFLVRLPTCVPALLACVRIAVPGAIAGALLAEWLATGEGLGYAIIAAIGRSNNTEVWACVALVTAASLALYGIASVMDSAVRRRWGG